VSEYPEYDYDYERIQSAFPGAHTYSVPQSVINEISQYFSLRELLPPEARPLGDDGWHLFDPALLLVASSIREAWGRPLMVNAGGTRYRGWRPPNCATGAPKSAHKEGRALDIVASWQQNRELWQLCLDYPGVREIESIDATPTWVHISVRGDHHGCRIIRP